MGSTSPTQKGTTPAPPKGPRMGTGPEACLGILEQRAAPQGPLPSPKPQFICSWSRVNGWSLDATQTHRQPAEGQADSALPGREPRPLNPEGQPSTHWKARTKAAVRVGQDSGTGRLGGLGDLASEGLGSSWHWEACRAWGGAAAVHFQLLESVRLPASLCLAHEPEGGRLSQDSLPAAVRCNSIITTS